MDRDKVSDYSKSINETSSSKINSVKYLNSYDLKHIYFIGLIDTLTYYGIKKKGEFVGRRVV